MKSANEKNRNKKDIAPTGYNQSGRCLFMEAQKSAGIYELKKIMLLQCEQDIAAFFCAFDDPACALTVADVDDLNVGIHVLLLEICDHGGVGAHAKADETIVERKIGDRSVGEFDDELVVANFLQTGSCQLADVVLLHLGRCVALCDGIKAVSDDGQEVNDGALRAALCEEFHNVETDCAAADDDDLLAIHLLGILFSALDHLENGSDLAAILVHAVMQACDGRKSGAGTGGVHDDIGIEALDHVDSRFGSLEDEEIVKLLRAVDHILGEIRQTGLVRDLGDLHGKAAELFLFLDQECRTSNFCSGAGSFETGSTAADYNYVARLVDMALLVIVACVDCRVDCAADGLVETDTVAGAAYVTGNALANVIFVAHLYLVAPVGICDQASAHTDEVCVASGQDLFRNLGITDVAHCDAGLSVFLLDSLSHVGSPAIGQVVGVDLELDRLVQTCGYVEYVDFFFKILQILEGIFQCVAAFYELICADTDEDREERTNLLTNFFDNQLCETSAVLRTSAELIGSLVHDRRKELADQIGVTAVDLDTVKACDLCALSSFAVLLDDLVDLFFLKRARNLAAFLGRNIGRRNGLHADSCGNSGSAGVVDLDTDAGAVLVNLLAKKEQTGNIIILVDSQLCSTIRSLRRINACVLNHQKSGAAFCAKLIVIDVQKAHLTGLLTVVGSHRSHHDTVFHCHSANRERLKNVWIIAFH